jgi:hypothetical protein
MNMKALDAWPCVGLAFLAACGSAEGSDVVSGRACGLIVQTAVEARSDVAEKARDRAIEAQEELLRVRRELLAERAAHEQTRRAEIEALRMIAEAQSTTATTATAVETSTIADFSTEGFAVTSTTIIADLSTGTATVALADGTTVRVTAL